jgi:putative oxidoreductase
MKILDHVDRLTAKHPSVLMNLLRMALGIILIWKGIVFGNNQHDIQIIIAGSPFDFLSLLIVQYIIIVHFAAGTMILTGILTRVAVLFQLPIVIGAMFYAHPESIFSFSSGDFTYIVFLLLITFLIYGSGNISGDGYLKLHPNG